MNNSFMSHLKTVLKIAKWEYLFKIFTSVTIRGVLLIIPILFSEAINFVTNNDFNNAILLIIVSAFAAGLYRVFEGINQIAYYKLYNKLFSYYNEFAISKTNDNSLFSLSRFSPGQYTNIVITDVDIISGFFTAGVLRVVQIVEFFVIYVYFFFIDINIFIFAVLISIIMLFVAIKSGNKVQVLNEKRKQKLDDMTSSAYDYFGGIREIKSFNIFDKIYPSTEEKVKKYLKAHSKYNVKFNFNNHMFLFVFEICRLLSVVYGIFLVKDGIVEVGTLLVIYNYYQKIIDNFSTILTINVEYRNLKVSLTRFNKLVEFSKNKSSGIVIDRSSFVGNIEFSNVLYGFRANPMLKDTNFVVPANSITVLTGNDEAAQNGIFDLLLKLNRQHEGNITLDGIDINNIDDISYFRTISSVRRNTVFFDVSIKENFMMINQNFDRILEICKRIGLDEEIQKLNHGYDTVLNDNTPISQSTKELLVIARMLLTESRILLFDDLVKVLDDKVEKRLIDLLMELRVDHTILIVSHSKKIIDRADLILDVDDRNVRVISR